MGTSTDGIFGFGIDLGDNPEKDIFDLPKIAELMEISLEEAVKLDTSEILNFISDYQDSRLYVKTHCSYSSPIYLLLVRESCAVASRGYTVSVSDHFAEQKNYKKIFLEDGSFSEIGLNKKFMKENYDKPDFIIAALWGI